MWRWRSMLFAALVVVAPPVAAAPDGDASWLMRQPLSMMDWGLIELGHRLDDMLVMPRPRGVTVIRKRQEAYQKDLTSRGLRLTNAWARYDWDSNRIYMQFGADRSDAPPTADDCRFLLSRTRDEILGGYVGEPDDLKSKRHRAEAASTFLGEVFRHPAGYSAKDQPADLSMHLAEMTALRISVNRRGNDDVLADVNCHGTFIGNDVSFELK